MPAVLVLFAIALVVTLIGLFLSPRSQASRVPDNRKVVSGGVRVASIPPISRRPRIKRVSELLEPDIPMKPLKPRASYIQARVHIVQPQVVRIPMTQRVASIAVDGRYWGRLSSWKVIAPGLAAIFLFSFYLLNVTGPRPLLWMPALFGSSSQQAKPAQATTAPTYAASQHLARLGQLDAAQYRSTQEYDIWAASACSTASMTEVINAYGHHYRITDILTVESSIHEITPQDGLLEEVGIQNTGNQFGFKTTWGHNLSLDQVIATANAGRPVIVSFPPGASPKFSPGHILVVIGGDGTSVKLADSSSYNLKSLSRDLFAAWWRGFYAILIPK